MAVGIYVGGKDTSVDSNVGYFAIALYVADSEESTKPIPAKFIQTESLTECFAGITDYGVLYFNNDNSDLGTSVTITAIRLDTGAEVEVEATLMDVGSTDVGDLVEGS